MKYEITDRTIYQTIYWVVESKYDVYYVRYNEDDSGSHWDIDSRSEEHTSELQSH